MCVRAQVDCPACRLPDSTGTGLGAPYTPNISRAACKTLIGSSNTIWRWNEAISGCLQDLHLQDLDSSPPLAALRNAQGRRTPQARRHHHPSCQIARLLTHPRPAKFMQRNRCPCGTSVARFGLPQPDGPAQQGRRQASSSNLLPHESNPARQIRSGSIARNRMTAVITRRVQNVCWRGPPTGRR